MGQSQPWSGWTEPTEHRNAVDRWLFAFLRWLGLIDLGLFVGWIAARLTGGA